jgi:purine-nucleoside phosphorylase
MKYKPSNVILVGCRGALSDNLKIGDVLCAYNFFDYDSISQKF